MSTPSSTHFVAHRGAHADHPENSLASIKTALNHLVHVEIDVHLARNGTVVVKHDPPILGDTLPTLQEALRLVKKDNDATLFIEMKPDTVVDPVIFSSRVIMAIEETDVPFSQIILISFSLDFLLAAKHNKPNIRCGFLTASDPSESGSITMIDSDESFQKTLDVLKKNKIDGIGLEPYLIKQEWIRAAHQQGFFTHVWLRADQENENTAIELADQFIPTYCNTDFAESFSRV